MGTIRVRAPHSRTGQPRRRRMRARDPRLPITSSLPNVETRIGVPPRKNGAKDAAHHAIEEFADLAASYGPASASSYGPASGVAE
jgi:hypothetical protein